MTLVDSYRWICIKTLSDKKKAYEIERVFHENNLPIQVREQDAEYAVWVPMKYKVLSVDILENFLIGNLVDGFVESEPKQSPQDKIHIGHEYERHIPSKFYFFLLLVAFFLFLLRMTYSIDFL